MRNLKKILSFLLVLSMVLSYVPMPALAEEVTCTHHIHDESCGFVEGASCGHVHGEGCGDVTVPSCAHVHGTEGCTFVAGTPAVSCHPDHNEDCGYVAGAACECDLSEGKEHLENCGYVAAVSCNVTHEGCGCVAEVPASGECNHSECTTESGCATTTFVCAHTVHEDCGYVEAKPCTFDPAVCEDCKAPQVDEAVKAVKAQIEALPTVEALSSMTYEEKIALHNGDYLTADNAYNTLSEEQKAQVDASKLMALGAYFADPNNLMTTDEPYSIVYDLPKNGELYYCGVENSASINLMDLIPEGTILAEGNKYSITTEGNNAFSGMGVTLSNNLKEIRFTTRDTAGAGTYSFTVTVHTQDQEDIVINVNVTLTALPEDRYTIKVAETANGTVTTSALTATAGESITVTATPNSNSYVLETLTVKDANGNAITVSADNTFTMPASNVTIEATFKEIVVKGNVYVGGVQLAIEKNYVKSNGSLVETDGDTYNARLEGSDESGYTLYINGLDVQGVQNTNNGAGIYYGGTGSLTIQVEGTNTVNAANTNNSSSSAIYTKGNLTITGTVNDKLTVVGATTSSHYSSMGIYAAGMTINGPTITASAGQGGTGYGLYSSNDITISGSTVTASADSGTKGSGIYSGQGKKITIENSKVTANGKTVGIESYGYSITISGANANVQATGGDYALYPRNGMVTVNGGTLLAKGGISAIGPRLGDELNCAEGLEAFASTDFDDNNPAIPYVNENNDTYKVVKVAPKPTSIPVWVQGIQITSENMADVLRDGKVSYNPGTKTLNLNGATITVSDGHAIKSNEALTITGTATSITGGIRAEGNLNIQANIGQMLDGNRSAIESELGTVTISGTIGDITTSANGINGKQGVMITKLGSVGKITATVNNTSAGIRSEGDIIIEGKVAGIHSRNAGIFAGSGSDVTISGTVGNITSDTSFAILAENISITGSVGDLKTQENSIYANGDITIEGTVGTINSNRAGIASNGGSIAISNSVGTISSNERYGITAPNGTISISNGAVVTAVSQNEYGLPAGKVVIAGGSGALAVKKNGDTAALAEVYGNYTMTDDFACDKLEVKQGAKLTISDDKTVEVTGALTNNGAIEIMNNGTLKLPENSSKDGCSGGILYIGKKDYQWDVTDKEYYCRTHNWTYQLKANTTDTIEADCTECAITTGGTLTIVAPSDTVYNGENKLATLTPTDWKPATVSADSIIYQYSQSQDGTYTDTTKMKDAGFYKASITVGGATASVEYTISRKSLAANDVTLGNNNFIYNGAQQTPTITVTDGGETLTQDTDYTVSYQQNNQAATPANAGTYDVVITGKGNYTGTVTKTFAIDALSLKDATVTLSENVIFKGENPPAVTVTLNGNTVAMENYTVAGVSEDGIVVTVVVRGQGNYKDDATAKPTYLVVDLPDSYDVEPDDKDAIDAYETYSKLNETYKDAELTEALKELKEALTAYDVIKGHKSSYVKGSYKKLSFTANGYFGKFTGVEVDGKLIDEKYYTAESGSTIITLKSSYLESLKTGKHTIQVNYTDGNTGGEEYFRITVNNGSPLTGDNSNILFFGGMTVVTLLCMAMMIVFFPRKKGKYQR